MTTTKLNNGLTVLARPTNWGISAYGYTNQTQATKRATKTKFEDGVDCSVVQLGRVFYIMIK